MELTNLNAKQLAQAIDHTLLKPEATIEQIKKLCEEAAMFGFKAVCVNPGHVGLAARELVGSEVTVCTVIGFPLGATTTSAKAYEATNAVWDGALELDMVINVGALKAGCLDLVRDDIAEVVAAAYRVNEEAIIKVILENCLLTKPEVVTACRLATEAGAKFVKTSTGFSSGGALVEDVRLMKDAVGGLLKVKASGGIRDWTTAMAMLAAGADRLGVSAGVDIIRGFNAENLALHQA
ncbi:MAG TPA: deoxyribose-phosphate aldolase [Bacillota bacterium]|nr:deoxyribose-phosphate aldolase [Bacillota bacterium]